MPTILSTGVGGASGMYTLKILKETSEFRLIACDASPYSSGFLFGDRCYQLPYAKYKNQFLNRIKKIVVTEDVDYIFPNVDEELAIFAKHNQIEKAKVIISSLETVTNTVDKYLMYQVLNEFVQCPKTYLLKDFKYNGGEWVVKPRFGRGSRDIFHISSEEMYQSIASYVLNKGYDEKSMLIQGALPGKEYTVDAICDREGRDLVIVPRERLMTSGGVSAVGRTVNNKTLIQITKQMIRKIPFLGPINIQFKEDDMGNPKLMEINPRCSGGMSISFKSGINIPLLAIKLMAGEDISSQELAWKESLVMRYFEDCQFNDENIIQG